MGHWLKRVSIQEDGTLREEGYVILDTPIVLEYAEHISAARDLPDNASLVWLEALDCEEELDEDECLAPERVLNCLRWIEEVSNEPTPENRLFWENEEKNTVRPDGPIPFSAEALSQLLARDLAQMIRLCDDARAAGQLVVHVAVP